MMFVVMWGEGWCGKYRVEERDGMGVCHLLCTPLSLTPPTIQQSQAAVIHIQPRTNYLI